MVQKAIFKIARGIITPKERFVNCFRVKIINNVKFVLQSEDLIKNSYFVKILLIFLRLSCIIIMDNILCILSTLSAKTGTCAA